MTPATSSPGTLWAIAAYFNPQHYQRRLANYRLFRKYLAVPLVTVQVSFDGAFDLASEEAEILISLSGKDVMWQKERLLNVAVQALPRTCEAVAWLDCDTILCSADWPDQVERLLDSNALVQPFSRVSHLGPDADLSNPCGHVGAEFWQVSIPTAIASGRRPAECMSGVRDRLDGSCVMGMAWAMRREVLAQVGIYDAGIIGGGTRPLVCAAYGCFEEAIRLNQMNELQAEHYRTWARRFFEAVGGRVSAAEGEAAHLWHGSMADRRYKERYQGLTDHRFDPLVDIAHDAQGVWRWNSEKPAMHEYVRSYFSDRKEDG